MPEGHTVHRLASQQTELVGRRLTASSPQGRFVAGAAAVDRRRLVAVDAYGKHLLHRFDGDRIVHVHLGMFGTFLRTGDPALPRPSTRLRLGLAPRGRLRVAWDLVGPTICELIDSDGVARLLARLGPDPLRDDADVDEAWRRLHASGKALGAALLDQRVLAGVGNVFRAEALQALGIHPLRPATTLTRVEFDHLWAWLVKSMGRSVEAGRIVGADDDAWTVYKQERCGACAGIVEVIDLGGRRAYACPRCQPAS